MPLNGNIPWNRGKGFGKYKIKKSGCWEYQGYIALDGYGIMYRRNKSTYAHRTFYEQKYGEIPKNLEIDHLCRNRKCVNPNHLEAVTRAVNDQRGKNAKLSPEKVRKIRELYSKNYAQSYIASLLNTPRVTIHDVVKYKSWKNID